MIPNLPEDYSTPQKFPERNQPKLATRKVFGHVSNIHEA